MAVQPEHPHEEHSSFIKTPKQLVVVMILAFLLPVTLIALLAQLVFTATKTNVDHAAFTDEAIRGRLQPVAQVHLDVDGGGAGAGAKAARSGEDVYKVACAACHATGAAGAPKLGDNAAWAPRIKEGLEDLIETAIKGKGAMPPRGGAADTSDFEIARAVVYMANASGGKFKEPEPPADQKTAAAATPAAAAAAPAAAAPAAAAAAPAASAVAPAAAAPQPTAPAQRTGEEIVNAACGNCHLTGEGGAPKIGDKAAWAKRISQGVDKVVAEGIKGHGNMPARGGWADLTDAEMKQAVLYMFNAAGAKEIPVTTAGGAEGSNSVYFASGKATLDNEAKQAIAAIAAAAKGSEGRIAITGYTDKTGNQAQNIELAKNRAKSVRDALVAAGVSRERIDMKPPVEITGGADDKQARRVDVAMTAAAAAAPAATAAAPAVAAPAAVPADTAKGKAIYDQACMACHASGAAGAPKLGDRAAWAPRIGTGLDSLYGAALKGMGAMPPKGGRVDLPDADIKAAVDYMVSASK